MIARRRAGLIEQRLNIMLTQVDGARYLRYSQFEIGQMILDANVTNQFINFITIDVMPQDNRAYRANQERDKPPYRVAPASDRRHRGGYSQSFGCGGHAPDARRSVQGRPLQLVSCFVNIDYNAPCH